MAKVKLTKKETTFIREEENEKDFLAYKNVQLYATTDIPLHKPEKTESKMFTPVTLWKDYDPKKEALETYFLSEEKGRKDYSFCALHKEDGNLYVQITVFSPSYPSKKAVLLIGDRDIPPQQGIIDAIVNTGAYLFIVDYNGLMPGSATVFPRSLSYGKHGEEGEHLSSLCPTAKDTCAYLYTLIHRRALTFIKETYRFDEITVLGIKSGTEIAMAVAGTEKSFVTALACVCGAGYYEYKDIPRFPISAPITDDSVLSYIAACSGISYLINYPNPVFVAIGSNGNMSDIDRLSALKSLIKGTLTIEISPQYADNIDGETFGQFLTWLNYSFWRSDFPSSPVTTLDINRDGSVYSDTKAPDVPPVKRAVLNYSYGNNNHVTRRWQRVVCETIGQGQYLAKMTFSKPCDYLFYYAEITYVNGLRVTEAPKFADLSAYRVAVDYPKPTAIIFRFDAEGQFHEVSENAVILSKMIEENNVPAGAKGVICKDGCMRLFLGDLCESVSADKILQVDAYSPEEIYNMEISVSVGTPATYYKSVKTLKKSANFTGLQFACTDFKDDYFRPLTEWKNVNTVTIVSKNVTINKLTFI